MTSTNKNLGKRTFDVIILDEVDDTLLDNCTSGVHLSSNISGFEYIRPFYIRILKELFKAEI